MTQKTNTTLAHEGTAGLEKPGLYRYLASSERLLPKTIRKIRKSLRSFSVPAPRIVVFPALWTYIVVRFCYHWVLRVFVCEPLFKAYCKQYGRGLHTGVFIHWVQGKGDIILGDNVRIDGRCVFQFAARFSDRPTLKVGDNSGIGHDCRFAIGKGITIGRHCALSSGTAIMDSSGHLPQPESRLARQPPAPEEVRPVVIGDGVWIGQRCIILPGVKIGDGSVIAAGSVVHSHVPPYSVVAGNPAKVVFRIRSPNQSGGGASAK